MSYIQSAEGGFTPKPKYWTRVWRGEVPFETIFWILGLAVPIVLVLFCDLTIIGLSHWITGKSVRVAHIVNSYPRRGNLHQKMQNFWAFRRYVRYLAAFIITASLAYSIWISLVMWKFVYRAVEGAEAVYIWCYATFLLFFSSVCVLLLLMLNYSPGSFYNDSGRFRLIGDYNNGCECHMDTFEACIHVPDVCVIKITDPAIKRVIKPQGDLRRMMREERQKQREEKEEENN